MTEPTLGAYGGDPGGTVGTVGRLVGFVGGLVGSGVLGSVDMGLDHSSNSATVAIFTNRATNRKRAAFLEALRSTPTRTKTTAAALREYRCTRPRPHRSFQGAVHRSRRTRCRQWDGGRAGQRRAMHPVSADRTAAAAAANTPHHCHSSAPSAFSQSLGSLSIDGTALCAVPARARGASVQRRSFRFKHRKHRAMSNCLVAKTAHQTSLIGRLKNDS